MGRKRIQMEYVDLNQKAIKIVLFDEKTGEKVKKHFEYEAESFDFDHITQDIHDYLFDQQIELVGKFNVVVSSYNIYSSQFIVPRNSRSREFLDNEIEDKFKDALISNDSFVSEYDFSKDESIYYVSLIPKDLEFSFIKLAESLKLRLGRITTIAQLLVEKERMSSAILYHNAPHMSLYIRKYYTIMLVVVNDKLIDSRITSSGYKEITKLNIVQRTKTIESLNRQMLCMVGKHELHNAKFNFNDFYIYCKDEVLRNQFFTYKNKIPYITVDREAFDHKLDLKLRFDKKRRKGFTLVETVVSMSIFTIVSAALLALMSTISRVSLRQEDDTHVLSAVNDMAEIFYSEPKSFPNSYFRLRSESEADYQAIYNAFWYSPDNTRLVYFDGNFSLTTPDKSTYTARLYHTYQDMRNQNAYMANQKKYTVVINDFKHSTGESITGEYSFIKVA